MEVAEILQRTEGVFIKGINYRFKKPDGTEKMIDVVAECVLVPREMENRGCSFS